MFSCANPVAIPTARGRVEILLNDDLNSTPISSKVTVSQHESCLNTRRSSATKFKAVAFFRGVFPVMQYPYIWVEDITENRVLRDVAAWMCALSYTEFYGKGLEPFEAYEAFFGLSLSRERVLMAFGKMEPGRDADVLGTVTLRFGSHLLDNASETLEFMKLFIPDSGDWRSFSGSGFDVHRTMEASRFAYAPRCMERTAFAESLRIDVYRRLYSAASLLGGAHGCDQQWSILPKHVAAFVTRRCGAEAHRVEGLRLNHQQYGELFDMFPVYFGRCKPAVYIAGRPANKCVNRISLEAGMISNGP